MHTTNSSTSSVYSQHTSTPSQTVHKDIDIEKQTVTLEHGTSVENTPRTSGEASGPEKPVDPFAEAGDEKYNKFTPRTKAIMVAVLSFTALLAPVSSTTVLSAVPEVAAQFSTSADVVNLSNALYLISMGVSCK
jgi:hypothetical protein